MWVRPDEEYSPQESLRVALVKVVTVVTSIDPKASFNCVYEDASAWWMNPETKTAEPVKPITCADDVPLISSLMEKYHEVLWPAMMIDTRDQKDREGNSKKQYGITTTLLLKSDVCEVYLCSRVVSVLGSDGIRLDVKNIQVLKTLNIACIICVSLLAELDALTIILKKVLKDMETIMIGKGKNKEFQGIELPHFKLSRRPLKESDIPDKFRLKGLGEQYRDLKKVVQIEC